MTPEYIVVDTCGRKHYDPLIYPQDHTPVKPASERWTTRLEFGKDRRGKFRTKQILGVLTGEGQTSREIAYRLKGQIDRKTLNRWLARLIAEGMVKRVGGGVSTPAVYWRIR